MEKGIQSNGDMPQLQLALEKALAEEFSSDPDLNVEQPVEQKSTSMDLTDAAVLFGNSTLGQSNLQAAGNSTGYHEHRDLGGKLDIRTA